MQREIVLDTETTGLDPASGHRVVEIGCVEVIGGIRSGAFFHTYLNPERDMPEEARRVHGLTSEFLTDKPVFAEKVEEFLAFISADPLVIHNAEFDLKFLNAELKRLGFPAIALERAVDTVVMARRKFPGQPANLDALCRRFNIDLSERTKHGALLDAELLADVYLELMGGRQAALLLDAADAAQRAVARAGQEIRMLEARLFPVSAEELAEHTGMLALLKKPLWAEET